MALHRIERIQEQLKKEISQIIQMEIKDPRVGFATVMDVELNRDLSFAKIFVSIMGNEEEKQKTLQGLDRAKGFIRSEVGNRIRLRHTPEIAFFLDKSLDHSMHIEGLLKKIKEEEVNDGK